jgi:hypothetical protein
MLPAARWFVVAVVAIACATAPALLRVVPAHDSDISAPALAKRIHASAALGWSGEVHAIGSLEVPLTGSTFGGVSRLLGGQTDLRVWWRDPEHWRLDRLRTSGEQDLIRSGSQTMRWTYESSEARFTPYSEVRLPNDSDALPPTLAGRLLSGAKASELSRLPATRVDGRSAVGLRFVPADSRTTIARVDVWADEDSGLPVRVDVYDEGGRDRPILTSQVVSLDTDRPEAALTSFETTRGMHFSRGAALDEAAGANAFAPFALPDEVADLPRRGRPEDQRAVGIYGRGPTALVAIPLRRSVAKGLYKQLSGSSNAVATRRRVTLTVGPLSVLLLVGGRAGLLLAGTVSVPTLENATQDLLQRIVRVDDR